MPLKQAANEPECYRFTSYEPDVFAALNERSLRLAVIVILTIHLVVVSPVRRLACIPL